MHRLLEDLQTFILFTSYFLLNHILSCYSCIFQRQLSLILSRSQPFFDSIKTSQALIWQSVHFILNLLSKFFNALWQCRQNLQTAIEILWERNNCAAWHWHCERIESKIKSKSSRSLKVNYMKRDEFRIFFKIWVSHLRNWASILIMIDVKLMFLTRKSLWFSRCIFDVFLSECIEKSSNI